MKYLVLENIRSAYNVGAIFRTAEGAGVLKIFLAGYTPAPIDRFGRAQEKIKKTSLGASEKIEWSHHLDCFDLIKDLKEKDFQVVAIEQSEKSVPLKDFKPSEKTVYIMGNEVGGVSESTLVQADLIVDIPMLGTKESLNVSVAAGIVLYYDIIK